MIADKESSLDIQEMATAGLHFGHSISKIHPKMKPYLAGMKNNIHIIDLEKSREKIEEVLRIIHQFVSENKLVLFVGTKIQIRELIKETADAGDFPYVINRWLGGTITNFEIIRKRVEYMEELEKKMSDSRLKEKYTKKEITEMEEKLEKLKEKFEGLRKLKRLPEVVFVVDIKKEYLAVKEAKAKGIKVIAICDTDSNPELADYFIPANDDAISSVGYILNKVKEVILKAKSKEK